jgi:hypothetical protein
VTHTITFKTGNSPVISDGVDASYIVGSQEYMIIENVEKYQGSALINHQRNMDKLKAKKQEDEAKKRNKRYGEAMKRLLEGSAFLRDLMKNF